MGLCVVILAAGKGKRMASNLPKVMHTLGGVPLIERVVKTAQALEPQSIYVVYGNGGTKLPASFPHLKVNWVFQKEQLGTGHAVLQALPECQDHDQVLVLYGDVPLITSQTLEHLLQGAPKNGVGVLLAEFENPTGFGRIIRDAAQNIVAIAEERDASPAQRAIKEINTGIITAPAKFLKAVLPTLPNNNVQKEYYLTDIVASAVEMGVTVNGMMAPCSSEVKGVNDSWQLTMLERFYQEQRAHALARTGVMIMDPKRLDIRGHVSVSPTTRLDVNVILEGDVTIAPGCHIGPNVVIKNSHIGAGVEVLANSVLDGATIENECVIGPFARIRPETVIKTKARVGNFVEMKKTTLGEGSKAPHLSYLGDATIGQHVNIGAGTITCNYDGANKWLTQIDDYAFIGSNASLIAPVHIEEGATIAAGSIITKNAPANKLTITRAKQTVVEDWQRPEKKRRAASA